MVDQVTIDAFRLVRRLSVELRELYATVLGEAQYLLDEDSGGNAALDHRIDEVLKDAKEMLE